MASDFYSGLYNPDVLTCLANLSNDEVFTPPNVANQMLDMLPDEIWHDSNATFLDPACKSGVFLREIAKRLIDGLADEIPDLQERIDHVFQKQLYGIAITELTSLLSRRSVYCSKYPNGKYSISTFEDASGNIRYKRVKHRWQNGRCVFCGASQSEYERGDELETHAYEWIHTAKPEEIFNMKFDVIIGNPPYQLNTAGDDNGAQAKPIYQYFVQQAIKLNPRYVTMITPSRWFSGGWGLDDYRNTMMKSNHIRELHDFQNSSDCFQGVDIKGGISYFLYDRDYNDKCTFVSHQQNQVSSSFSRFLQEENCDIVIRYNELIPIYIKVCQSTSFSPFGSIVSGRSPFGLNTNHHGEKARQAEDDVPYYEKGGFTFIARKRIIKGFEYIAKYKLYTPKVAEDGKLPGKVIGGITYGECGTICSGTYLTIGPFDTELQMKNAASYMKTKFFRALVAANKISQNAYAKVYSAVPIQDFSEPWTDEKLYAKYGLTDEEIAFIESMIRPMELGGDVSAIVI